MKPAFVLDASIAMAWCFVDEATPATDQLLERMRVEAACVPGWWYLEVTNVLVLAERRRRILADQVAAFVDLIGNFELHVDEVSASSAFTRLLPICRKHNLTCYDAVYLELAWRRQLPLATRDDELRRAARSEGIELLCEP